MKRAGDVNQWYEYILQQAAAGDYHPSGPFRLVFDCPLPECRLASRKVRHFYVNKDWYGFRCYRTGTTGSFKDLVLANPVRWRALHAAERSQQELATVNYDGFIPLDEATPRPGMPASWIGVAYEYCMKRGLTPADIVRYRVCLLPWEPYVYFPVWNDDGEVYWWFARLLPGFDESPQVPKTKEPPSSSKPLFGSHVLKKTPEAVTLVEGVFDHVATPDSFATMGSFLSYTQIDKLRSLYLTAQIDRVFLIRDPDAKDKARSEVLHIRRAGIPAVAVFIEDRANRDPNDLGHRVMAKIVQELRAIPLDVITGSPFLTASVPPADPCRLLHG